MNKIGNEGVKELAAALETNSTLIELNLEVGNSLFQLGN